MSGADVLRFLVALALGYVLGSIPSGVLVSRLFGSVDPRTQGSGKTGATNVLRALGPGPAVMVAVLDILKGVAAILLTRFLVYPLGADPTGAQHNLQATAEALAGFGALLGSRRMNESNVRKAFAEGLDAINRDLPLLHRLLDGDQDLHAITNDE